MKTNQEQLFICHSCNLEWSTEFLKQINKQGHKYCVECVEEMTIKAPEHSYFTCELCRKRKEGEGKYCHVKNMPDKRNSREISLICSFCSYYKAKKENFYCPRFSSGRDSWDPKIPEFDCYCPRKKYF